MHGSDPADSKNRFRQADAGKDLIREIMRIDSGGRRGSGPDAPADDGDRFFIPMMTGIVFSSR